MSCICCFQRRASQHLQVSISGLHCCLSGSWWVKGQGSRCWSSSDNANMLTLHHKTHKHLAYSTVFYLFIYFWCGGGGVVEAHQGASWGGERTTMPPPRLQQGFHDRSLPAAPREAHPHRWGSPLPLTPLSYLCLSFSPTQLDITCNLRKSEHVLKIAICAFPEERNYICDQCGQTFKQRKHLSVHQMRHSGAKPLQ